MRSAASAVFILLIAACASQPSANQNLTGRYALVLSSGLDEPTHPVSNQRGVPFWGTAVRDTLVERGATVDIVSKSESATGYDAVIYLRWSQNGTTRLHVRDFDASGARVSSENVGKLYYEIVRDGRQIGRGATNLMMASSNQMLGSESPQRSADVTAAKNVAAQIVKDLARG